VDTGRIKKNRFRGSLCQKSKPPRRSFSDEFKQTTVDLVVKQNYSFKATADAVGVSSRSLRERHEKRAPERQPCDDASVELLREENKQLKQRLQRTEMERDFLKKATARRRRFKAPAELSRGNLSEVRLDQRPS
jgi:transposase-like protein